jgi:uncharacterized protein (DUF169 family)
MFDTLETDPDVIMVYGNPAQIWALVVAYHDMTGKRLKFYFCGHAPFEAIVSTAKAGEPWVTIPCGGRRGLSVVESNELFMTFNVAGEGGERTSKIPRGRRLRSADY